MALLLAGCSSAQPPQIQFIGIAKGTLATNVKDLAFQSTFEPSDRELIGVVAFEHVDEGTDVTATWFSPDDRQPPFGRKTVRTESGATIVRFSLANKEDWQPSPYMMEVRAVTTVGKQTLVDSGALHFVIGLDGDEIQDYVEEYSNWQREQQERETVINTQQEWERALVEQAQTHLNAPSAILALRHNLLGDDHVELVVLDTKDQSPYRPSMNPAILLSHPVRQFAIISANGSTVLSLRLEGAERILESGGTPLGDPLPSKGPVTVSILPSGTVSLTWQEGNEACTAELSATENAYREETRECR